MVKIEFKIRTQAFTGDSEYKGQQYSVTKIVEFEEPEDVDRLLGLASRISEATIHHAAKAKGIKEALVEK